MFKYIPEYDYDTSDYELYLRYQIIYREALERTIMNYIDFSIVDKYISNLNFVVPNIEIEKYNFYHFYSTFNSKYVFLRNNIHIERLNKEEMNILNDVIENDKKIDKDFIIKTMRKVIFEEGSIACYGTPLIENIINSQSMVFEFAYDDKLCLVKEQRKIVDRFDKAFTYIKTIIEKNLNVSCSKIVFDGFDDDIYKNNDANDLKL